MSFLSWMRLYGLAAAVFFLIDLVWIGAVARDFYRVQLGSLLRPEVHWPAALLFYAIYILGVIVFAVAPALDAESATRALVLGGCLGLFGYATFDLTCLALFRGFPLRMAVVDMVWGTLLTSTVAVAGFGFGRWLGL
jgi:uncharacterized membrane protein